MLQELRVENYAVIDNVTVHFAGGLNLLTGETGAGKSILIDALAVLLGDKASTDSIRHGTERAVLSCVFLMGEGSSAKRLAKILDDNGIDHDSEELIIRREITAAGKGRVFVNNQPATVAVLKQLAPHLASIHAQNDTLQAFDSGSRLHLLDRFAGIATEELAAAFAHVRSLRIRLEELRRNEQDRLRLVDLWSFQNKEIDSARLERGEDERLATEKRVLANSEKLYGAAMGAYESLYDGATSASSLIKTAERMVEELARYDSAFQETAAQLAAARATVEDSSSTLRDYAGNINASPERLAELEDRLALIDRLKRKYGQTLDEVIAYGADAAQKFAEMENRDEVIAGIERELATASRVYLESARAVSQKRFETAKRLQKLVEAEINDLAMKAQFKIQVSAAEDESNWSAAGFDEVQYLIATNPGEPLNPIQDIASGGELSRVMLALKASVETNVQSRKKPSDPAALRTLVFDEIDAGIGGRAAEAVGKKLKSLARNNQVLCITHLPQIASFADQHFVIEKKESSGRTRTSIRPLEAPERREEIARMLSGAILTDASLKHAEQMLKANA